LKFLDFLRTIIEIRLILYTLLFKCCFRSLLYLCESSSKTFNPTW